MQCEQNIWAWTVRWKKLERGESPSQVSKGQERGNVNLTSCFPLVTLTCTLFSAFMPVEILYQHYSLTR